VIPCTPILAALAAAALVAAPGAAAAEPSFQARGSVEQVYVTEAEPGTRLALVDAQGRTVKTREVNDLGAALFRRVKPGDGYRVRAGAAESEALTVMTTRSEPPSTDVYDQEIPPDGYGYLTTRDGTKLAYSVHPPSDVTNALGIDLPETPSAPPYPTLIEYSGYGYARPSGPQSGIAAIANIMGFAVVDVNMRGTGCSGGAYDFFEPLQNLDGYDVIETVARQPWVAHGKVGMFGISYGGISQLFTAQTQPPSLAAISPISVIDQVQTTLYPGGILNTGFAFNWAKERAHEALPAGPEAGQEWAYERIQEGDETCKANQALHAEATDLLGKVRRNNHYRPKVADPLSPITFVDEIEVPTFMACQHTDEQTGGHCPTLASRFTGTDKKWFTFTNGTHVDSLAPETFNRLYDFLMLYVAKQPPAANSARIQAAAPVIYDAAMGVEGQTLPPDPIQQEPTYEGALEAFEALPSVRILFDNGAGDEPGHPVPGFERSFPRWPVPGREGRSWFFAGGGRLAGKAPRAARADVFRWNAKARPLDNLAGGSGADPGGVWTAAPDYEWKQDPAGTAVAYVTKPLDEDTAVIGGGAVHAWVRASRPNLDLQATISEVRPDGKETFVQGGWLRGALRKLDPRKGTRLEPVLSLRKRDERALPSDRFVKVTIPLYYQTHAYREGSRIRVRISAPNGDQPIWSFKETKPRGKRTARVEIGRGKGMPSRVLLPVAPEVDAPTDLPPCPGLRGQPCRDYEPLKNRSARR
jgi:uncharacterized protein